MMQTGRIHVVRQGEYLALIARRYRTTVAALARHNGIRNINLIHVGQRLVLSPASPRRVLEGAGGTAQLAGGTTQMAGGRLLLSATDVLDIKKTLQTEWVQSAGEEQAHGIVDTILNRTASRHWGASVADVVNARNQFSDINGPVSRKAGRRTVAELPASVVSRRVDQLVESYLTARAAGRASSVGTHLNYANPHFSDAVNLPWIKALNGPVLGRGNAIHRHGTTSSLERHRPSAFIVVLPTAGGAASPDPGPAASLLPPLRGRRLDGNAAAAANGVMVKSGSVRLGQLDPVMKPVIRAVADVARRLQLPTPVITSGNDSRHKRGSLHYADRALDFRGNNINVVQGRELQNAVRQSLGSGYDVEFEVFPNSTNNHLHVEYDPD